MNLENANYVYVKLLLYYKRVNVFSWFVHFYYKDTDKRQKMDEWKIHFIKK